MVTLSSPLFLFSTFPWRVEWSLPWFAADVLCFLGIQMCTGLDFHSFNSNFYVFQSALPVDLDKICCSRHIPLHCQVIIVLLPGRILWSSPALCMSEMSTIFRSL